jgi:hypothetical protein
VTISEMGFVDPFYAYYDSRLLKKRSPHVPLREEVVPIHDIRVTFGPGYRFRRIHLEPEGRNLEVRKTPEGVSVVVSRLEVHSMVVGELEATAAPSK